MVSTTWTLTLRRDVKIEIRRDHVVAGLPVTTRIICKLTLKPKFGLFWLILAYPGLCKNPCFIKAI